MSSLSLPLPVKDQSLIPLIQVSLDRCAGDDTCILYCTTGILLQKLIQDKNLREFSHVILDEVHDREADMDFCILVIKQLMRELSSQVLSIVGIFVSYTCVTFDTKNV